MKRDTIGPYKILEKAGEGAFGIVWKVQHETDEKIYAIKEIAKKKITPELMENLLREVQISFKLEHENITKCYNTLESKKNYYIIFEYCSGGDLENYLKIVKRPDIKEALYIMKQLRDVFKYLLSQNILHRDIKLENILLKDKEDMIVKLSDFGCSKADAMGATVCGTPKYMALEVMDNEGNYDYKADMWSLGLVFWELIFGADNFPFSFKTREALKNDIKNYSGKNLRFPKFPVYPDVFYNFFRSVLDVSPQMRMDAEEFNKHPIFDYDGTEDDIQKALQCVNDQELNDVKDMMEDLTTGKTPSQNGKNVKSEKMMVFADIKKTYNLKILEINLIKGVCDNLIELMKDSWDAEFLSKYCCLTIILIKKASAKADVSYKTLSKGSNAFKLKGFNEFMEYPNEYNSLKEDLSILRSTLKKLDDDIYSKLLSGCYSSDFLENVNKFFYKKAETEGKSKFIGSSWKYVYNKNKDFIPDYEQQRFDKIIKRIGVILKGKVAENLNIFY